MWDTRSPCRIRIPEIVPRAQMRDIAIEYSTLLPVASGGGDLQWLGKLAERSLRGRAIGRRNWTFLGSDNGGRTAAILTSITATCKRLGIDPFEYLRDVFHRISTHPQNSLDDFLPDKWKETRAAAIP